MSGRVLTGYVLVVVTALLWAGAWITARLAAHDAPPLTVATGRFLVASVALLPVWRTLERGALPPLSRADRLTVLGMSVTGVISYTVLFLVGVSLAPASDGAVITPGLVGPFTILLAWPFLGDRPCARVLVGSALALAGVVLVGWSSIRSAGGDSARVAGDGVFVVSALTWAVYTLLARRLSDRVPAVTGILLATAIGAVLLAPIAWARDGIPDLTAWSGAAWVNVVYLGTFGTAVAFTTYYLAVRFAGLGRVMPALGLVPFFGVVGAAFLLGETLTLPHAAGGILVVAGIAVPAAGRA
jgi:drug/metabolite transporter (DMT)-like permease